MPRPNGARTIGAEDNLRASVRRILEEQERSAAWLAKKMTEAGCPVDVAMVWKTLNAGRKVTVDEGLAIAVVLGVPFADLIRAVRCPNE